MDRTLILVKPDAFARGLTGEIIARFERKGLRIAALKQMTLDADTAKQHYAEHDGKPFFGELVDFITSLDGYASGEGWPGFWGLQGPEYLAWLDAQPAVLEVPAV